MFHYSTFVYLSRASEKLKDAEENLRFPGEFYVNLYAATELAGKLVGKWSDLYSLCFGKDPKVNTVQIDELEERFRTYRNRIHTQVPAVVLDADNIVWMVRPEYMENYDKWTSVLHDSKPEHFVKVRERIHRDFLSLCSALETTWKEMCDLSGDLIRSQEYLRRQGQGQATNSFTLSSGFPQALLSSATAVSSVGFSETAWTLGSKQHKT